MKPTGLIMIVAALLALGGGILVRKFLPPVEHTSSPSSLPDFNLPDMSGNQHNISEWQGKVRVINFWASWCPSCRKEIPEFIALQKKYAAKDLQFIGIATDDNQKPVDEYLATTKTNYPILIGGFTGTALAHQLGNRIDTVPFTLIVNQQGQIIHRQLGEFSSREEIMEIITPLLN